MQQPSSSFKEYRRSKDDSTENGTHQYEARFVKNVVSSKEEAMQFCNGLRMVKPTEQRMKPVSVFQDPRYSSMSQRFDENLSTLRDIDSKVNRHVEDRRKRKALKVRNAMIDGLRRADMVKTEQNEKLLRFVDEGQMRNKFEVGWARNTSEDFNGKNPDGNGFKVNQNKNSIDYEKSNGNRSAVKWIENDLRSWNDDKNSSSFWTGERDYGKTDEKVRKIKWKGDTFRDQNDDQEADENRSEIKWIGDSLANQNDYKKKGGSGGKIKWDGNRIRSQSDNEKPGGSEDETALNEDIHRDSNDIKNLDGDENKIKRNGNDLINQNGDGKSDGGGGDMKFNENVSGVQNRSEELDENGDEIEWKNGNDTINKNEAEKLDRNAEKNEENKNGARHQNGEEEPNSGFPRKTKTLGLLCRKFFLKVLEYVNSGDDKINLESIACSMEVEKRRIYDVVNVMEALGAMEKSHKSFYTWKGLDNLPSTLHILKKEAEKEGIHEKVLLTQQIMTQFMEIPNKNETVNVLGYQASLDEAGPSRASDNKVISIVQQSNLAGNEDNSSISSKQFSSKKKESKRQRGLNSLTYLCKYFFKILIVGLDYQPDYKVSLDVASTILINDPEIDGCKPPDRSRCRRIYDVANVLISLRLIERRMFTFGTKKIPLFMYCGPKIIENGKFDFFHHIRFNKLSIKLKNSEEKKAYEMEEENLEIFFLKQEEKKKTESSAEYGEPANKRSRIEEADPIQKSIDLGKENIPSSLINQAIVEQPMAVSIIRPQPQKFADLRSPLSQTSSSFNAFQSVLQQPRFTQFIPLPVCAERFLSFDPNIILLNNGNMLHNVNATRIPMQQNFNYLNTYPMSSMTFFQQPRGPMIDAANTSCTGYNNRNNTFIAPKNSLRSSLFNIDSILGNRESS